MHTVRYTDAPAYESAGHFDMAMRRLQGREAGPSDQLWLGVSVIAPGGGTTLDTSAIEKLYVVLDGEVTISNGETEVTLSRWDSCRIAPGEGRALKNGTDKPATILLAMPLAPASKPE
jgi:quercetin dioxygenase-like cupin family protein